MVISKPDATVAAVNNRAHPDKRSSGAFDEFYNFGNGATGGYDILYDKHLFAGFETESPADRHDSVLAFSKNCFNSKLASHFRSNNNSSYSRRDDGFNILIGKMPL